MASLAAAPSDVQLLLELGPVVIAGYNGPHQTVISGAVEAVEMVCRAALARGIVATPIPVSHAFHSPLVEPAAEMLYAYLTGQHFEPMRRRVMSTVTGEELLPDTDVRKLLRAQVLDPVRFAEATRLAADEVDLLVEIGPARVLTGLAKEIAPGVPAITLDVGGPSIAGLLSAVGAAYVLGQPVSHEMLFVDRFTRPLKNDADLRFFASPCETAPALDLAGADPVQSSAPASTADTAPVDGEDTLGLLLRLAAERAELPLEAVQADSLPLDELHLSSITVGQIMNEAASVLGVVPPAAGTNFATATLRELAAALDELAQTQLPGDGLTQPIAGVDGWVRSFSVEWTAAPLRPATASDVAAGEWRVIAPGEHPLTEQMRDLLATRSTGSGVMLLLPADSGEDDIDAMLTAAHAALGLAGPATFAVVQHGRGAAALAKTLHLEAPHISTCVIELPTDPGPGFDLGEAVLAEIAAVTGFTEVRYDPAGNRSVPVLRPLPLAAAQEGSTLLSPADVLLVTGGGKGITAECALELARSTGVRVGLLGRSDPAADSDLSRNLDRLTAAGVQFRYVRADVTSAPAVAAAVEELQQAFGPVTAVLHGAGRNEPQALTNLDGDAFRQTLAPKISGLRAVLDAVDVQKLRLLVTFGSIIGRAGLRGEADYAVANDWMTDLTLRFAQDNPQCRCLAMEWSVWSGAGMGERLGVIESLMREGITPIPTDSGIEVLLRSLADPSVPVHTVISGRTQGLPTITLETAEMPLLRFVDQPRVFYPGIELVADADLSSANDPYLDDHLLDGSMLFPAVVGMEAMSQAAAAVTGRTDAPVLGDVEFLRPIVVQPGGSTTIRVAVLVRSQERVEAVIRSSVTGFQADHFRAVLTYPQPEMEGPPPVVTGLPPVRLDALRELYGGILFQGKRFQRLLGYRRLMATSCEAEISLSQDAPWFGTFLPQETLLGDLGARDAFMHSIQPCVPDATLLPVGVRRLIPFTGTRGGDGAPTRLVMYATEQSRDGDTYAYDIDVRDDDGALVERWESLRLQAVRKQDGRGPWLPVLLGPYLERRLPEMSVGGARTLVVEPGPLESQAIRRDETALALARGEGRSLEVRYRPDGKPEVAGLSVSASHGAGVTLAVTGAGALGCDVQQVLRQSPDEWKGMLSAHATLADAVAQEAAEDHALSATRVWSAIECVRKSGRSITDQISLDRCGPAGWVVFALGELRVATFVTTLVGIDDPVVFAVLAEQGR